MKIPSEHHPDEDAHVRSCRALVSSMRSIVSRAQFVEHLHEFIPVAARTKVQFFQSEAQRTKKSPRTRSWVRFQHTLARRIQHVFHEWQHRRRLGQAREASEIWGPFHGAEKYETNATFIQKILRGWLTRKKTTKGLPAGPIIMPKISSAMSFRKRRAQYQQGYLELRDLILSSQRRKDACDSERQALECAFRQQLMSSNYHLDDQEQRLFFISHVYQARTQAQPLSVEISVLHDFLIQEVQDQEHDQRELERQILEWVATHEPLLRDATRKITCGIRHALGLKLERKLKHDRRRRARRLHISELHYRATRASRLSKAFDRARAEACASTLARWWKSYLAKSRSRVETRDQAVLTLQHFVRQQLEQRHFGALERKRRLKASVISFWKRRDARVCAQVWQGWLAQTRDCRMSRRRQEQALWYGQGPRRVQVACRTIQRCVRLTLSSRRSEFYQSTLCPVHPVLASRLQDLSPDSDSDSRSSFFSSLQGDARARGTCRDSRVWHWLAQWRDALERLDEPKRPWSLRVLNFLAVVNQDIYWQAEREADRRTQDIAAREERGFIRHYVDEYLRRTNQVLTRTTNHEEEDTEGGKSSHVETTHHRHCVETPLSKVLLCPSSRASSEVGRFSRVYSEYHSTLTRVCVHCHALLLSTGSSSMLMEKQHTLRTCLSCGHRRTSAPTITTFVKHKRTSSRTTTTGRTTKLLFALPEFCDLLVIHAYFHCLAPVNHSNRLLPATQVWTKAREESEAVLTHLYTSGWHDLEDWICEDHEKVSRALAPVFPTSVWHKLQRWIVALRREFHLSQE